MDPTHEERMRRFLDAGLYVATSHEVSAGRRTLDIIRAVLAAGVTLIQIREKELSKKELFSLAVEARRLTSEAGALLLINDNLDVALASGADGVHLGQDDFPIDKARELAPELIIGASSTCVEEAIRAEKDGASYVNIGPIYPTETKVVSTGAVGINGILPIAEVLGVPFTVMGGIKLSHIPDLLGVGVRTIAVISAVTAAESPALAAAELLAAIRKNG